MNNKVIAVENLGKKYVLSHRRQEPYLALRDVLTEGVKGIPRKLVSTFRSRHHSSVPGMEEFWALKDVSFEIQRGDRVGIIGRNGAGKSTLLKIVSRITEPTEGRVRMKGRVASLLEVGTGFHPELTGRENIYLNGAILGMTKSETRRKFDEIVAFAEVEKFLDTPVKRYSSGMYVRLAFAVAAHLEPEILLVDEVLAVGDTQFQEKCLGRMEYIGREGRTVLFVSHNMAALQVLCNKAIQIRDGKLIGLGSVHEQIETYLRSLRKHNGIRSNQRVRIGPNLTLENFDFVPNPVESGQDQEFEITLAGDASDRVDALTILLYNSLGMRVSILDLRRAGFPLYVREKPVTIRGYIKKFPLVEGDYHIGVYVESKYVRENFFDLASVTVTKKPVSDGTIPYPANVRGVVELDFTV